MSRRVAPLRALAGILALAACSAAAVALALPTGSVFAQAAPPGATRAASAPAAPPPAALMVPWSMFGRTPQHAGRTPVVGPQSSALRWSAQTAQTGFGDWSPIVGPDGTVYVGDAAGVRAFSATGAPLWSHAATGATVPALGPGGRLYAGTTTGLLALGTDGALFWTYPSGPTDAPVVVVDGTVYAIGRDALRRPIVHAVRPDGTAKWSRLVPTVSGMPAIGAGGTVYVVGRRQRCTLDVCFYFGQIFALNPTTGQPRLLFDNAGGGSLLTPVIGPDGTIYAGTEFDGPSMPPLFALRPDGSVKWQYPIGGGMWSPPALGWDGAVYAGGGDAYLYAIRADGTLAWRYTTHGVRPPGQGNLSIISSPAVGGDGKLYFAGQDQYVYALNPGGTLAWEHPTTTVFQSSAAIGPDGTLFVSGRNNPSSGPATLFAFGPGPGTISGAER